MSTTNVKRIAVIGGGPAGVAAAKHLLTEKNFTTVDVFEQQSRLGGVWDYVAANNSHATCSIPQNSANVPLQEPIWRKDESGKKRATYVSPVYDRLEANIPKTLMQHSDMDFPDSVPLFPSHDEIEDYLVKYAEPVKHMIQLETQVTLVEPILGDAPEQMKWTVHTTYLPTLTSSSATYDAVLIASGHYTVPRVPDINNIAAFVTRYKDNCSITHSKAYSSPEQFHGKKVLVVGGGPSAVDIAAQISTTCSKPLLISTRSPPTPAFILPSAQYVAEITSFLTDPQHNRAVRLLDGTILADLDAIVFCTGYIYAYPFLPTALPSAHPSTPPPFATHPLLHPDGTRVHALYKHLFYAPAPTLAFLTLPWNIVPFPVAEGQAAVVARVWAGRTALPPLAEMLAWERARVAERGDGKAFHRLAPPEDVEYVNELRRWSEEGADGGESTAPHWGVYMRALRFAVAKIKKAYGERGEQRREIMTLEELGVVYDEAKGEMRVGEDE